MIFPAANFDELHSCHPHLLPGPLISAILGLAGDGLAPAGAEVRIKRRILAAPAKTSKKADAAKLAEVAWAAKVTRAKWDAKQDATSQPKARAADQGNTFGDDLFYDGKLLCALPS